MSRCYVCVSFCTLFRHLTLVIPYFPVSSYLPLVVPLFLPPSLSSFPTFFPFLFPSSLPSFLPPILARYTTYEVVVRMGGRQWSVRKRYSQFDQFRMVCDVIIDA